MRARAREMPIATSLDLFPTDIQRVDAIDDGVDNVGRGVAYDGYEYVLKSQAVRLDLPMSEWLSYAIADKCQLPTAMPKVCKLPDSTFAFGSRWVSGTYTSTGILNTPDQLLARVTSPGRLYGLIALDLFLGNADRHSDNLLFVSANAATNFQIIDFSRATLFHAVLPSIASIRTSIWTGGFINDVKHHHKQSLTEVDRVIDAIQRISADNLRLEMSRVPAMWRTKRSGDFVDWWASDGKRARLDDLAQGLWNGAYL